jgi:hypothetical protein
MASKMSFRRRPESINYEDHMDSGLAGMTGRLIGVVS